MTNLDGPNPAMTNGNNSTHDQTPTEPAPKHKYKFIDIGLNLTDGMYSGFYHGSMRKSHPSDHHHVMRRAIEHGVEKVLITGSDLAGSKEAISMADGTWRPSVPDTDQMDPQPTLKNFTGRIFATVGIHPCSVADLESPNQTITPEANLSQIETLALQGAQDGTVLAYGEFGLDYDRLQHSSRELQLKYFALQLDIAERVQLPLFLHSRAAASDFEATLRPRLPRLPRRGVVHSFTGTLDEMHAIIDMGFDVGVNGCSLKTEANLAVVREIPLERIQLETDGPWCEIRPGHASGVLVRERTSQEDDTETIPQGSDEVELLKMPESAKKEKWEKDKRVKGRNESCTIGQVACVVAKVKSVAVEEVVEAAWRNSERMFWRR